MSIDQVDPLPNLEGDEPRSLENALKTFLLYYYYFEIIIIYNIQGIQGERFIKTLMNLAQDVEGMKYLKYLQERGAYTVNVAASQLGFEINKLYRITNSFLNMGVLVKAGKLSNKERGPSTYIYALRDAPQSRIDEAAQLYKDVTSSHVNSLDEYLQDYDYKRVAEEAIKSHLNPDGTVDGPAVVRLLAKLRLYGEDHRVNAKRLITAMGYRVVS